MFFDRAIVAASSVALVASFATAAPVLITASTTVAPGDTTITPTAGGVAVPLTSAEITVVGATLTIDGVHSIASLVLDTGSVLTHSANATFDMGTGVLVRGLELSVAGAVEIRQGASIDLDGKGYPAEQGPGPGFFGECGFPGAFVASGGSHGGRGANRSNAELCGFSRPTSGSYEFPDEFGSGGGNVTLGGAGGGRIKIDSLTSILVDGEVTAAGENATGSTSNAGGGGAGGSIWLEAPVLSGAGSILANAGTGVQAVQATSSSGGGGRVRLAAETIALTGQVLAGSPQTAGSQRLTGGAGTVLFVEAGHRTLVISNGGVPGFATAACEPIEVEELIVRDEGVLAPCFEMLLDITVSGDVTIESDGRIGQGRTAWVNTPGLIVEGNGFSGVDASFTGDGPGGGRENPCGFPGAFAAGGAGHGGRGGGDCSTAGFIYGDPDFPDTFGSAGGGDRGFGGGAIRLSVGGTLTVDGAIEADGGPALFFGGASRGGGGAGGSILIFASSLTGTGSIHADGGNGRADRFFTGGGGGGGRIAIYSCDSQFNTDSITAFGGAAEGGSFAGFQGSIVLGGAAFDVTETSLIGPLTSSVTAEAVIAGGSLISSSWTKNGQPIAIGPTGTGSTVATADSSLRIDSLQADDAGIYQRVGESTCGTIASQPVIIDVLCDGSMGPEVFAWAFTDTPTTFASTGDSVTLRTITGGVGGPFSYVWSLDGVPIDPVSNPSATEAELVIASVTSADFGNYSCRVTGANACNFANVDALLSTACPADVSTTGATLAGQTGFGVPDGTVDLDDLGYYLTIWLASDLASDLTTTGATLMGQAGFGVPDGAVDLDDLGFFLAVWLTGCP